ncbi:glycosyltransferase family 4 protein [Planktomarina temperata]|nr:glycosyltransferase family 4 protein [Planktomarina temperata]
MEQNFLKYKGTKEIVSNFASILPEVTKNFPSMSEVNILYLSNVLYSKGILYLIDAIDHLVSDESKEIHLYIGGDFMGDEYYSKTQIEALFRDKIIGKRHITYLGFLNEAEKEATFQMCHLLALPSFYRSEAQPISIIEGISYGMPILTTNHSYLPNLIDDKSGILVEPKNTQAIVKGINYLMDRDQWNKISDYNYSYYRHQFSKKNAFNKLQNILGIR